MSAEPARIDDALVDAVARRVVDLLREEGELAGHGPRLMTVAEVGEAFGVSADWVCAHAQALGAIRPGDGPRARLRFERDTIATRIARVGSNGRGPRKRAARSTRTPDDGAELLPISNPRPRRARDRG